mmetsp:Transcript_6205/g.17823  ORF Transcript_6205/g.17823 Transcript_6205/m.17823 type:complete len:288 (-) Transcript_6205:51-914(-)
MCQRAHRLVAQLTFHTGPSHYPPELVNGIPIDNDTPRRVVHLCICGSSPRAHTRGGRLLSCWLRGLLAATCSTTSVDDGLAAGGLHKIAARPLLLLLLLWQVGVLVSPARLRRAHAVGQGVAWCAGGLLEDDVEPVVLDVLLGDGGPLVAGGRLVAARGGDLHQKPVVGRGTALTGGVGLEDDLDDGIALGVDDTRARPHQVVAWCSGLDFVCQVSARHVRQLQIHRHRRIRTTRRKLYRLLRAKTDPLLPLRCRHDASTQHTAPHLSATLLAMLCPQLTPEPSKLQ